MGEVVVEGLTNVCIVVGGSVVVEVEVEVWTFVFKIEMVVTDVEGDGLLWVEVMG